MTPQPTTSRNRAHISTSTGAQVCPVALPQLVHHTPRHPDPSAMLRAAALRCQDETP